MQIAFDPVVSFAPNFSSFFRFVFFCSLKGIFQKRQSRFRRDDEVSGKNDSSKGRARAHFHHCERWMDGLTVFGTTTTKSINLFKK